MAFGETSAHESLRGGGSSGAPQGERVIARTRRNARILFWPVIALLAIVGATAYFYGNLPERWQNMAVLIAAPVLLFFLVLGPYVSWLNRRYTITTRRVIVRRGVLMRTRQELLHSRGYSVTLRRGPLQSIFRCGDLVLNSGIEAPVVLKDVPGATLVQTVLHDLIESAQHPRGPEGPGYAAGSMSPDGTSPWG